MSKQRKITEAARARLTEAAEYASAEVDASTEEPTRVAQVLSVPVEQVSPNVRNVRQSIGDVSELRASIEEVGVLQALVVRPLADGERGTYPAGTRYVVMLGHRRLAAAIEAGLAEVPVQIRAELADAERQAMLIENLQRENLTPLEEATAFAELLAAGDLSQRKLAQQIGLTQAHISRRLSLLKLQPQIKNWVEAGRIGVDVAVNVVGALDEEGQAELAGMLVNEASDDPDEVLSPAWIRDRADDVRRDQEQRRAFEEAVAAAEARGAEVMQQRDFERAHGRLRRLAVRGDEEIDDAAEAGALVAYVEWWGGQIYYFDTRKSQTSATSTTDAATSTTQDTTQARAAEWRQLQKDTWTWVQAHPRPPRVKDDLLATLADHVLEVMRAETGKRVHQWLIGLGEVEEGSDYYAWLNEVTGRSATDEDLSADRARIAWLATIAHDMGEARHQVAGQPAERAIARVTEVQ